MICKEIINKEGKVLYRTFSDTYHKIQQVKNGQIYDDAIDVRDDIVYEEIEDYIDLDGVSTYEEIVEVVANLSSISRKVNIIGLTDNEALSVKEVYPKWESYIDKTIEVGFVTLYNGNLWRARQTHIALGIYPPSIDTAAIYEVIVESHDGSVDDPIPYTPPMEIFKDKYYTQNGVKYYCTRDSGIALSHDLSALVGIYVE
jgi:hypothetical protein